MAIILTYLFIKMYFRHVTINLIEDLKESIQKNGVITLNNKKGQ